VAPFSQLLGVDEATVRKVLRSWGPGKFDAELLLDGQPFGPTGRSAATLIPPAFGLAGVNLHTYTGWGSVPYWNAFVAVLEMQGKGAFFDPRLNDASKFPIAAANGFGNVRREPDLVTPKLGALQLYQLAIPAPKPPRGTFDRRAAERGAELFAADGKARCASCHVPPLYTEPGFNLHKPEDIGIDAFQAQRSPDRWLPHDAAARALDAHEGRLLSRRPFRHARRRRRSLRLVPGFGVVDGREARSRGVLEVALTPALFGRRAGPAAR
jgi:hypothetical protein